MFFWHFLVLASTKNNITFSRELIEYNEFSIQITVVEKTTFFFFYFFKLRRKRNTFYSIREVGKFYARLWIKINMYWSWRVNLQFCHNKNNFIIWDRNNRIRGRIYSTKSNHRRHNDNNYIQKTATPLTELPPPPGWFAVLLYSPLYVQQLFVKHHELISNIRIYIHIHIHTYGLLLLFVFYAHFFLLLLALSLYMYILYSIYYIYM